MLEPLGFLRAHHSYLVFPSKIIRFGKAEGGSLISEDNLKEPLTQRKKE